MSSIVIRSFAAKDARAVQELFVRVNRLIAPPHMVDRFEAHTALSTREEIGRIADYYSERKGGFWVAECSSRVIGMFGLETVVTGVMELRRMYVAPDFRRRGIARAMLEFAEAECRRRGMISIVLSTSELQQAALGLYLANGCRLTHEEVAQASTNKTIGGGIRRYHLMKPVPGLAHQDSDKERVGLLRVSATEGSADRGG